MSEIERVAKGLTEAQLKAVNDARQSFGVIHVIASPATLNALKRKGITEGLYADRFTPLGLQVRDYLKAHP